MVNWKDYSEKMEKLYRHELDFERTMEFVKDNLTEINVLSAELLNLVDFKLLVRRK